MTTPTPTLPRTTAPHPRRVRRLPAPLSRRVLRLPAPLSRRVLRSPAQRGVSKHGVLPATALPLLLLLLAALPAAAQTPPRTGLYVGVASCASSLCHGAAAPRSDFGALQNEYRTWLEEDPHARAFETLSDERSRAIGANLGDRRPAYEIPACLACHTLVVPRERQASPVEIEDGVACESCHGPAGGWLDGHHTEEWSHQDSLDAGLVDLTRADRRAALCLGCHLGDAERTVDHRLIAAGHPELTFELDNYAADMPPHWPPPSQVRDRALARRIEAGRGAGAWAVGQAVAFRREMEQLSRAGEDGRWRDFAVMRCADCHHSLREERWRRQAGRRGGEPGLPRWSPARWVVLRHLVEAFAPDARRELDRRVAAVAAAVSHLDVPPARMAADAAAAARAMDGVVERLAAVEWTPQQVDALLLRLAADRAAVAGGDRESAEQVMLAFNSLLSERLAAQSEPLPGGMVEALEAMAREVDDPYAYDADRFATLMARFERRTREEMR